MTNAWPDIPYEPWKDTAGTLHQWLQIVGKFRLAESPWVNHSWHATFYLNARGLTTSLVPYRGVGVEAVFDFPGRTLSIERTDGARHSIALEPMSVAEFYQRFVDGLRALSIDTRIHGAPNELPDPVPFAENKEPAAYDGEAAERFWRAMVQVDRVMNRFRTGFLGKVSPVHLFWGSFDLAVTRFSGRTGPRHPGGFPALPDAVTREAYSHEVSSAGFWSGAGGLGYPAFYSYAYPVPEGFATQPVEPAEARFDEGLGEFLLSYDAVRTSSDPDQTLLSFLQTSYEAAAVCGKWDREALETPLGEPGVPRRVD